MKVLTSREFNQDVSRAKRLARIEPVFVTDRGKATHVLMSVEAYRKLAGQAETIVDLLAMPSGVGSGVGGGVASGEGGGGLDAARSDDPWGGL